MTTDPQRTFFASVEQGVNTLVSGPSGAGKTSTLRMLELRLREASQPVCFVSFATVDSLSQAIAELFESAVRENWLEADDAALDAAFRAIVPYAATDLLRRFARAPAGAVILVDDVGARVGHDLFGRLRDELWQLDVTWGVATRSEAIGGLLRPPADAFFERRIELQPWTDAELEDLVVRRLGDADPQRASDVVGALRRAGGAYPRELISRARLLDDLDVDGDEIARAERERRTAATRAAGRAGAMVIDELEHLGPVSASDAALLDRLGWTRPRAVDVLGRLEDAGVVRSFTEQRDTPGRPRKLYALRPLEDFLHRTP